MKENREFSKEKMEKVFQEIYKDAPSLLERQEWIEDGQICHTWKINTGTHSSGRQVVGYTNDAGAAQIHEAMKREVQKLIDEKL